LFYYITFKAEDGSVETRKTNSLTEKNLNYITDEMTLAVYELYEEAKEILTKGNISKRYKTTYIPKRSGKKRRIDEPDEELKAYMKKVVDVFTNTLKILFPQSSYAYIQEKSSKDMAIVHKNAYMIMKFDIKDFFKNCSLDFIMKAMETVYPFCIFDTEVIKSIVKACMLKYNGVYGLPQGAPTSPILSNIAMIPFDFEFERIYNPKGTTNYSRYADDIVISVMSVEENSFMLQTKNRRNKYFLYVEIFIESKLWYYNKFFSLNHDKSTMICMKDKCGAWVLGIMVNKDGNITIGHENKQKLKAVSLTLRFSKQDLLYYLNEKTFVSQSDF